MLRFPRVNIGHISDADLKLYKKMVRQGEAVKYTDYTFPKTKTGYAKRDTKKGRTPESQAKMESIRSLLAGSWKNAPPGTITKALKAINAGK